jgi:hypothetical protein
MDKLPDELIVRIVSCFPYPTFVGHLAASDRRLRDLLSSPDSMAAWLIASHLRLRGIAKPYATRLPPLVRAVVNFAATRHRESMRAYSASQGMRRFDVWISVLGHNVYLERVPDDRLEAADLRAEATVRAISARAPCSGLTGDTLGAAGALTRACALALPRTVGALLEGPLLEGLQLASSAVLLRLALACSHRMSAHATAPGPVEARLRCEAAAALLAGLPGVTPSAAAEALFEYLLAGSATAEALRLLVPACAPAASWRCPATSATLLHALAHCSLASCPAEPALADAARTLAAAGADVNARTTMTSWRGAGKTPLGCSRHGTAVAEALEQLGGVL